MSFLFSRFKKELTIWWDVLTILYVLRDNPAYDDMVRKSGQHDSYWVNILPFDIHIRIYVHIILIKKVSIFKHFVNMARMGAPLAYIMSGVWKEGWIGIFILIVFYVLWILYLGLLSLSFMGHMIHFMKTHILWKLKMNSKEEFIT